MSRARWSNESGRTFASAPDSARRSAVCVWMEVNTGTVRLSDHRCLPKEEKSVSLIVGRLITTEPVVLVSEGG